MALVAIDLGHVGRTGGRPGATHGDLREEELVVGYASALSSRLLSIGYEVAVLGYGTYSERQDWAASRAVAYIACHTNAGRSSYGLVLHDYRSALGARVAESIAESWREELPELSRVVIEKALPVESDGRRSWTANAYGLISRVYSGRPFGLVLEPGFIDRLEHSSLWTESGLRRIGWATANALHMALG